MYDTLRPSIKLEEAGPSTPVNLTGLDVAPGAGDKFYVLDDIARARELAQSRENQSRQQSLSGITTRISLEENSVAFGFRAICEIPMQRSSL